MILVKDTYPVRGRTRGSVVKALSYDQKFMSSNLSIATVGSLSKTLNPLLRGSAVLIVMLAVRVILLVLKPTVIMGL